MRATYFRVHMCVLCLPGSLPLGAERPGVLPVVAVLVAVRREHARAGREPHRNNYIMIWCGCDTAVSSVAFACGLQLTQATMRQATRLAPAIGQFFQRTVSVSIAMPCLLSVPQALLPSGEASVGARNLSDH